MAFILADFFTVDGYCFASHVAQSALLAESISRDGMRVGVCWDRPWLSPQEHRHDGLVHNDRDQLVYQFVLFAVSSSSGVESNLLGL